MSEWKRFGLMGLLAAIVALSTTLLTGGSSASAAGPCQAPQDWRVYGYGQWYCDGSMLRGYSAAGQGMFLMNQWAGDFDLSANVMSRDREASLAFRVQDENNGYFLVFVPEGVQGYESGLWFVRRVAGAHHYLWNAYPAPFPHAGQAVNLRVIGTGPTFRIFVNGVPVGSIADPTYASGMYGYRIFGDPRYQNTGYFMDGALIINIIVAPAVPYNYCREGMSYHLQGDWYEWPAGCRDNCEYDGYNWWSKDRKHDDDCRYYDRDGCRYWYDGYSSFRKHDDCGKKCYGDYSYYGKDYGDKDCGHQRDDCDDDWWSSGYGSKKDDCRDRCDNDDHDWWNSGYSSKKDDCDNHGGYGNDGRCDGYENGKWKGPDDRGCRDDWPRCDDSKYKNSDHDCNDHCGGNSWSCTGNDHDDDDCNGWWGGAHSPSRNGCGNNGGGNHGGNNGCNGNGGWLDGPPGRCGNQGGDNHGCNGNGGGYNPPGRCGNQGGDNHGCNGNGGGYNPPGRCGNQGGDNHGCNGNGGGYNPPGRCGNQGGDNDNCERNGPPGRGGNYCDKDKDGKDGKGGKDNDRGACNDWANFVGDAVAQLNINPGSIGALGAVCGRGGKS